jgi:hypothetical protein
VTAGVGWWRLLRVAVALVWVHQGLWHKVLAVDARHLEIVASVPEIVPPRVALGAIGIVEAFFGVAVLLRLRPALFAWLQILALAAMNGVGLAFAAERIPDVAGMLLMNTVFALAIWGLAHHAPP